MENVITRARREYHENWHLGRPIADMYLPIYLAQKGSPDWERRHAARVPGWIPSEVDRHSAGLQGEPIVTPELIEAYERAWDVYDADVQLQVARHEANPFAPCE
jgi:hypothetical protein